MADVEQVDSNKVELTADVDGSGFWLAYIWRETPVLGYQGLPIYDESDTPLPSPPWKWFVGPADLSFRVDSSTM